MWHSFIIKGLTGVRYVGLRSILVCCLLCLCSHDAVMDPDSEDKVHIAVDGLGRKFVVSLLLLVLFVVACLGRKRSRRSPTL